ncbi:MAG: hypothetical protein WC955_09220, partial [Elusimicrobiota bacterium]
MFNKEVFLRSYNRRDIFEELNPDIKTVDAAKRLPGTSNVLNMTADILNGLENIPLMPYTLYREFEVKGTRNGYQDPYFLKRSRLAAMVVHTVFGGRNDLGDRINDYLWSICEETVWVLPAHKNIGIDLAATETSLMLAEILRLLDTVIPAEIHERVTHEIYTRVLNPYIENPQSYWWNKKENINNWCGVCNGKIGATLLHLEEDTDKLVAG